MQDQVNLAVQVSGWGPPGVGVAGIVTLTNAWLGWARRRVSVNLALGRRAYRVRRMVREWVKDPALNAKDNLTVWKGKVEKGEAAVEALLEEMVDLSPGATNAVAKGTKLAYLEFMRGATFINKHGHPDQTGHKDPREQALAAKDQFTAVLKAIEQCVPKDLDGA
jgi:hypothetical protein